MKSNPTRAGPSSFGNLHSNLERGYEPGPGGNNRRRRGQVKIVREVSRFGSDGRPSSQPD